MAILSTVRLLLTLQQYEEVTSDQRSLENPMNHSRSLSTVPLGNWPATSPGSIKSSPVPAHTNNIQNLAPPPPAPHGPRLLSPNQPRSRTPSPQRSTGDITTHSNYLSGGRKSLSEGDDGDGYDIVTPIGLSEKALGKRRVVEEVDERVCFSSIP